MNYRSHYDLIYDMLDFCTGEPVAKTKLMYHCNLSFTQLKRILPELEHAKLIKTVGGNDGTLYKITEKGRKFIDMYPPVRDLVKVEILVKNKKIKEDITI